MKHKPEIIDFINKYSYLFWYTPEDKRDNISLSFLVETILNYGNMNSVKELISLLGIKRTAKIFFDSTNISERRKGNYFELTLNYFFLFFRYHVS